VNFFQMASKFGWGHSGPAIEDDHEFEHGSFCH